MSFTFVQRAPLATTSGGASVTATFTGSVTAGHLLAVLVSEQVSGALPTLSIADSGLNSYALADSNGTGGTVKVGCSIYWTQATAGGSGFTVTVSGVLSTTAIEVSEWSTAGLVSVDAHNSANGNSSSLSPGSMTTSGPSDLVIAVGVIRTTGVSWTPGSGFSTGASDPGSGTTPAFLVQEQTGVSAGSITASMGSSASNQWACVSAAFKSGGSFLAVMESHDAFSGSGHFSDIGSMAVTAGSDTASFSGHFKSPATMAVTAASDVFAGNAKFLSPATMAKTEAHDIFVGSGHFATSATMATTEGHDVFAGTGIGPTAGLSATERHDTFSGTALVAGNATMAATERHDTMSAFAMVSPRLLAIERGDIFAGSATATTSTSSMAVTAASDVFVGTAGFTYDTRATMHRVEHGDVFAGIGTQSSTGSLAAHEHGDSFAGSSAIHVNATMGVTEGGDVFRGGFESILYSVYANTGHGDPINFSSPIDVTDTLTYTTSPLSYPGVWSFDVRAKWRVSGLEEQNVDARVDITLDSSGKDISNLPPSPLGLRAFSTAGSTIRAEWTSPPATPKKTPIGFHVYWGSPTISYGSIGATVLYNSGLANSFVANIGPLTNGTAYQIGVRAYNATSEETNTSVVTATADGTGPTAVVSLTATAVI